MAAAKVPLPAWVAVIVVLPVVKGVIVNPLTEATAGLEDVRVTVKPEEAVGETTNGPEVIVTGGSTAKVIVWGVDTIVMG